MAKAYHLKDGILLASVNRRVLRRGQTVHGEQYAGHPYLVEIEVPDEPMPLLGQNVVAAMVDDDSGAWGKDEPFLGTDESKSEEAAPKPEPPKGKKKR